MPGGLSVDEQANILGGEVSCSAERRSVRSTSAFVDSLSHLSMCCARKFSNFPKKECFDVSSHCVCLFVGIRSVFGVRASALETLHSVP